MQLDSIERKCDVKYGSGSLFCGLFVKDDVCRFWGTFCGIFVEDDDDDDDDNNNNKGEDETYARINSIFNYASVA